MNGAFRWHGEAKGETTQVRFEVAGVVQQLAVDQQHLELSASAWADLVDLLPAAGPGVTEYKVSSWGKQISCFETSRRGRLVIAGQRTLDTFRVSYCQHPDFSTRQKVVGLLGLRDLMDSVITLDYRSLRWSIERPTEDI